MTNSTAELMVKAARRVLADDRAGRKIPPEGLRWASWVIEHKGNPPGLAEKLEANRRKVSPP